MSLGERIWDALRLLGVLLTYVVARRPVRPLADEASRALPGDDLVADAKVRWKHAVTIRARPAEIWPWLVQMGCRRAGWYSYDRLDNGGVRSADRILAESQRVQVGDIFPMAPKAKDMFRGGEMTAHRLRTCGGERRRERLAKLLGVVALSAAYWFPVKRWCSWWGSTAEERARAMHGDGLIANPTDTATTAITVNAPREHIWPWLVQIGYQRGGLYSYDWLDRLFGFLDRPSATRILPEFQQLAVGDTVPWGRTGMELTVGVMEPLRALGLTYQGLGMEWVWQFGLYPIHDQRTRLVIRSTERVPNRPLWWLGMRITEPAAFIMTRRMLLNLKGRAEAL
jgi:hypothetical protein